MESVKNGRYDAVPRSDLGADVLGFEKLRAQKDVWEPPRAPVMPIGCGRGNRGGVVRC
jgi:hypothetical protein